jgi:predicted component of viral defense system (DUF524 family)
MAPAVDLNLCDATGSSIGVLSISALPRSEAPQNRSNDPTRPRSEPEVQLREATAYRYTLDFACLSPVRLEPAELFDPDDSSGITGRLYTRQYVGDIGLAVCDATGQELGSGAVLVRAAKLEHEHEYHRMLREIADLAAEAVLQGFAPSATRTAIVSSRAPRLLYQQFAILQARLQDEELHDAIAEVIHRPQRDWVRETEWRPPGRPLRAGSEVARALTAPGQRVRAAAEVGPLHTLPSAIQSHRTDETLDTIANRFVKFALTHWRDLAAQLGEILTSRATASYGVRGTSAVSQVIETLDDLLSEPLFRQVGRLHELPTSNQVLLKREGYRQIFATFALIESSLDLSVELDDAVHPSQRNIAALYEYWTFLKLVQVLGDACDDSHAALRLFERDGDGLSLGLKRGRQSRLRWAVSIAGRGLTVSVFFNRTFRATDEVDINGSWSTAMVPDASVRIRPDDGRVRVEGERDLDVWLHFDAKYKLDWSSSQFERPAPGREREVALEHEEQERQGSSRRDDLLKMHAYRDAIRRSAGAYVLFPGTAEPREFREYVELIPGLGAFPLRPGSDAGVAGLRRFIGDVLLHAADQATAEERNRYWTSRIFHDPSGSDVARMVDFLDRPPADTKVLLDDVFDEALWRWIDETDQYLVTLGGEGGTISFRAEELAAPLILLHGAGRAVIYQRLGAWTVVDEHQLKALRHPRPTDRPGLLCGVVPVVDQPTWLAELPLADLMVTSRRPNEPALIDWSQLVQPPAGRKTSPPGPPGPRRPIRPPAWRVGTAERRSSQPTSAGASQGASEPTSRTGPNLPGSLP